VYNVENVDHDYDVRDLVLPASAPLKAAWMPDLLEGVTAIEALAEVHTEDGFQAARLLAIPNYTRLNRGGWSQVWITEDPDKVEPEPGEPEPVVQPIVRPELDQRTVDRVLIGNQASEKEHRLRAKNSAAGIFRAKRWRHAGNGWFSYELKLKPDSGNRLLCTYWGSDIGNRRFAILVDDQEIARQVLNRNRPGEFFDVEYEIPTDLLRDKEQITVRIEADPGATAGGIFDLRVVTPAN
jgi:hypothetical protein